MDRGDFAAAVDRHYPGLLQRLTLVLHDAEEAKDVAQEAYLKAFQTWSRFDGTDARAWLHTSSTSESALEMRATRRGKNSKPCFSRSHSMRRLVLEADTVSD